MSDNYNSRRFTCLVIGYTTHKNLWKLFTEMISEQLLFSCNLRQIMIELPTDKKIDVI